MSVANPAISSVITAMQTQHIVYLHGFNSSPQSTKAQQFLHEVRKDSPATQVHCPQLHHQPLQAMDEIIALVEGLSLDNNHQIAFVGSSLGGFYATWLADYFACRAVLINPAVKPHDLLADYLGIQHAYHDTSITYELTVQHLQGWQQLQVQPIKLLNKLWVLLQTGDKTLDYRQAEAWYQGCVMDVQIGGSHAYENFIAKIPHILAFLR